jgi:hypothetical protein
MIFIYLFSMRISFNKITVGTVTRSKISICSVHMGLHAFLMLPTHVALRGVRGKESPALHTPPA